ncbi:uncharacterized protein LOC120152353 [Hibiscus syriacus]|uniref:uncharacterized protein LOC120152353 n=1 Tax=Hibiscus syriacus TaxID=106335 RepID=UPI0019223CA5|nr:uncharacterized protein LOC120152353 [Hibiscus syriacus]
MAKRKLDRREGGSLCREFSTQIKEICDLLATSGSPVSEVDQIVTLLNWFPSEFEPFVAAITVSLEPCTIDTVTSVLIDAESRLNTHVRASVSINMARHKQSRAAVDDGRSYSNDRSNNSQVAGGDAINRYSTVDTAQINSLIAKWVINVSDKWYPDLGATHHVTYERPGPSLSQQYSGKGKVYLGDGSVFQISHVGQIVSTVI